MRPSTDPTPSALVGLAQAVIALGALLWAGQLWRADDGQFTDRVWGALALAVFAGALAPLNLLGPLRDRLVRAGLGPRRLFPHRLHPYGAPGSLAGPMLGLALAFGLPVFPLSMLVLTARTPWIVDLQLIWLGLIGLGVVLAAAGALVGGRALYQQLAGGRAVVEISRHPVTAGEAVQALVAYQPGRLAPEAVTVDLVCQAAVARGHTGPHEVVRQPLGALPSPAAGPTERRFEFALPLDARASTSPHADRAIFWYLEVAEAFPGAPDARTPYHFTALPAPAPEPP